ncbi:MAG: sensor histidine kinase, partial [Oscillospiraceae bacterium]
CGIIESELPFIFNRFYIGENNQHNGGSGLGLYIVKNIIEEVGGGVSVTSKQSVGTVFTIYIPLYLSE